MSKANVTNDWLRTAILGLLTFFVLLVYIAMVSVLVNKAMTCSAQPECAKAALSGGETCAKSIESGGSNACKGVSSRFSSGLAIAQSLVSALVISVLALSAPGKPLATWFLGQGDPGQGDRMKQWAVFLYVVAWLVCGGTAYIYGNLLMPDALEKAFSPLVDLGSAWFGLAIAAAYAYLGIKPNS